MLCHELQPQLVLGVVVGSNYQMIEKDKRSAPAALASYLQNQYRKDGLQAFGLLSGAKMKMIQIPIKPAYMEAQGYFPLSFTVQVPVAAVYGEALFGNNYTCYLPTLEKYFHYYDNTQLDTLIRHFATDALNNMQPKAIFQLLRYPKPILEIIEMKIKDTDHYNWYSFHREQVRKNLNTLTEPLPLPRSVRKRLSALPDVAWEQEEKVQDIMEKIIGARANVLVVGNSGSGKSAILGQAIRKITGPMLSRRIGLTFWRMLSQRITADAKVLQHFVTQTGLPELFLRDDLLLDQTELQAHFEQHIIGQPEAIKHLMRIVKIYKAGLNNPNKPIATMLFAGPTGVGKTACAKVLADYFFGQGQKQSPLIRIDMSEFQYSGQISCLIGRGHEVGNW